MSVEDAYIAADCPGAHRDAALHCIRRLARQLRQQQRDAPLAVAQSAGARQDWLHSSCSFSLGAAAGLFQLRSSNDFVQLSADRAQSRLRRVIGGGRVVCVAYGGGRGLGSYIGFVCS